MCISFGMSVPEVLYGRSLKVPLYTRFLFCGAPSLARRLPWLARWRPARSASSAVKDANVCIARGSSKVANIGYDLLIRLSLLPPYHRPYRLHLRTLHVAVAGGGATYLTPLHDLRRSEDCVVLRVERPELLIGNKRLALPPCPSRHAFLVGPWKHGLGLRLVLFSFLRAGG